MSAESPSLIIIGYGNPARGDDGLGPALARACEMLAHPRIKVDVDYQLTVEHALYVTGHDLIIFADAMFDQSEPFVFQTVEADRAVDLGSHSVSPSAVMRLARDLYDHKATAHVLGISGIAFGLIGECLSDVGQANLTRALTFLEGYLRNEIDPGVSLSTKETV